MTFPNLPGVTVTLNDLGLQISPPPAGPKVTLLGITSNTGVPINEPLTITNLGQATAALWFSGTGSTTFPGELAVAAEEAAAAGAGAIEIMVIDNSVTGQALYEHIFPTGTYLTGRYEKLSGAYDILKDRQLDIVVPVNAWIDNTGNVAFGTQLANFCYQTTTEVDSATIGVIPMMPVLHWANAYATGLSPVGLSGEAVAITPSRGDFFFGTPSTALVSEWAKYASQVNATITNLPTEWSSFLDGSEDTNGVYYPTNDENAATAVNTSYWTYWQARDSDDNLVTDALGNKADAGSRISVIGAPLLTTTTQTRALAVSYGAGVNKTFHITDGAAGYAGFIARLRPHSAPTNKQIASLSPQRPLSSKQANEIVGRRIVTFHTRSTGFVVSSAVTGAHNVSKYVRSDYVRLTTVRIVDAAIDIVRSVGDRFIGEPNTAAHRNAMSAEIDKYLAKMRTAGALNDYQFFISATPDQQVLGEALIELALVPAFELIKITVNVSLKKEI